MSAIVYYSEYEARLSNFRYMLAQHEQINEAVLHWIRENSLIIDATFSIIFLLYLGLQLLNCYRYCFPPVATEAEPPVDKKQLRNELAKIDHVIQALKSHRSRLILKLKSD
jgi:hypothetical protein